MIDNLPDIQIEEPTIKIPIRRVGVDNVLVPIFIQSLYGKTHETVATVSMGTNLDERFKGISMSKLLRTLIKHLDNKPLKHEEIKQILIQFRTEVETESTDSYLRFSFKLPISVKSPKSGLVFPQYYDCSFEGRLNNDKFRFFQKVRVQYSSYCPCSASLCNDLKEKGLLGYPHSQRSFADVLVEVLDEDILWLEEIIKIVEDSVKTLPAPLLRRMDEQEFARIAAENPAFVEDMIRSISNGLNNSPRIFDWICRCTHEESIHTSDAVAVNFKGLNGGFTDTLYL